MIPTTQLTFIGAATGTVYVEEVNYSFIVEPFERREFDNQKLRDAPTASGAKPIILYTIANAPIQVGITCTGDSPRPLGANSLTTMDLIYQKFNIYRVSIKATANPESQVNIIQAMATQSLKALGKFQSHQDFVNDANISYADLIAMQSETFSYLTSTGISVNGTSIGGLWSNVLISEYSESVAYDSVALGVTQRVKDFNLSFEIRQILPLSSTS